MRKGVEDAVRSNAGPPVVKREKGCHLAVAGIVLTAITVVIGFLVPLILMPTLIEGVFKFTVLRQFEWIGA